jgi:hypothetical protein
MQYASQYFTCSQFMCPDVFIYIVHSHYFTSIFLSCVCLLMCALLTYYFTRKARTYTGKRALAALRRTQRRCNCGEFVSDCFLPPPRRVLLLNGNQLLCVPLTTQARAALIAYNGPQISCIFCETGKFSTASSPRCSTVMQALHTCLLSGILLPRMYEVAAASSPLV